MATTRTGSAGFGGALTRVLGALLGLIGLMLIGGGAWLLILGGSPYYLAAGVGLALSGGLMMRLQALGAWLYLVVFLLTVVWALWEVGLSGWGLVPRLVGPAILALLVILTLPVVDRAGPGGRRALAAGAVWLVLLVGLVIGVLVVDRPARPGALPEASMAMTEPSLLPSGADWPAYGGTYSARRFSPLGQITPDNVGKLEVAWTYHTRDLPPDLKNNSYGAETTPLKVGNTLYLCTAKSIGVAVDPVTGKELWRYDPKVADHSIPYTAACRGVSYYAVPGADPAGVCATRIIWGTLDARLIAVDARTGRPCADFGQDGQVDTAVGFGPTAPGMISITSAPTIVRGVVVTGHQILDGQRRDAPSGAILGYDAVTGALRWAWDMQHPDWNGLPPAGQTFALGSPNMWTTASGDEALGLVFLPLGNVAADYWSGGRTPEQMAHSTSLVALDVTTGKPVWSFQTVHNDVWDYDLGSQATLVDFPTAGGVTPAVLLPSKQGDLYILDRRTGRSLTGLQERPAPQGGVEAALRSATQPHSLFHTLRKPDLTEKAMWGMSPIDQMACRIQFRQASYKGFYTPPETDRRWIEYPGYNGGSDWGGVALDPMRGVIVANYNDMPNYNRLIPRAVADRLGWAARGDARGGSLAHKPEGAGDPQVGTPYAISVNAGWRMPFTGLLCKEPPYGGIRAIDLKTGRTVWDRPIGTARNNGPFGIPSGLNLTIGTPNNGGAVVTAGGLVFIAAATDDLIRAIDLKTGKVVWTAKLPGGGQATPMTYEAGGRQYVVIMAGGHHFMETKVSDALVAYALPG